MLQALHDLQSAGLLSCTSMPGSSGPASNTLAAAAVVAGTGASRAYSCLALRSSLQDCNFEQDTWYIPAARTLLHFLRSMQPAPAKLAIRFVDQLRLGALCRQLSYRELVAASASDLTRGARVWPTPCDATPLLPAITLPLQTQSLQLLNMGLAESAMPHLGTAIAEEQAQRQLTELELILCDVRCAALGALADQLQKVPSLRVLNLSFNPLAAHNATSAPGMRGRQSLGWVSVRFPVHPAAMLCAATSQITRLNLAHTTLSGRFAEQLCSGLAQMRHLADVDMSHVSMGPYMWDDVVVAACSKLPALRRLSLASTRSGAYGQHAPAGCADVRIAALRAWLQRTVERDSGDTLRACAGDQRRQSCAGLHLDMQSCCLCAADMQCFASPDDSNGTSCAMPALQSLKLAGNVLQYAGAKRVADSIEGAPQLTQLQLASAGLTSQGVNELYNALLLHEQMCASVRCYAGFQGGVGSSEESNGKWGALDLCDNDVDEEMLQDMCQQMGAHARC